jgi:hypothetical protein
MPGTWPRRTVPQRNAAPFLCRIAGGVWVVRSSRTPVGIENNGQNSYGFEFSAFKHHGIEETLTVVLERKLESLVISKSNAYILCSELGASLRGNIRASQVVRRQIESKSCTIQTVSIRPWIKNQCFSAPISV